MAAGRVALLPLLLAVIACRLASGHGGDRHKRQSSLWQGGGNAGLWHGGGVPQFWRHHNTGPYGLVIRGWQFAKCASHRWSDYKIRVDDVTLWPKHPRLPGPIFFNVTVDVRQPLDVRNMELQVDVRRLVQSSAGEHSWSAVPCHGWDVADGCGGVGSCRYCDVMQQCRELVNKGQEHARSQRLRSRLDQAKLCPPPVGSWTITFSQTIDVADLPKGMFGNLQSNQYWFTFKFNHVETGETLACARLWMDICKYHLYDKYQTCLRDPTASRLFARELAQSLG